MIEGSLARERANAEITRLCYAGLDEEELLRQVSVVTRRAVPFDVICMHTNDPASGFITRTLFSDREHQDIARRALERVYFEDDVAPFNWMAQRRLAAVSLTEATGGKPERAVRYHKIMRPLGVEHELRGVYALDGELWGSLTVMREQESLDFDEREVGFFRRIAPHLAAGLKAATIRREAFDAPDGFESPGVLILDQNGRVTQYTAAAERWLADLGDLDPGWQEGTGLPAAVSSIAGAIAYTVRSTIDHESDDVPRLLVRGRSGRWLAIHGARTEPGSTAASETAIVIEPAGPREVAWLKTSAYGLTEREREVVDLVVRGATTRQIADALFISEYTVQEHLSNVFEKVGTRSRRALVKRLYLESLL